jgi:hypothetical protein
MKKYWIWLIPLALGIFSAYHVYVGFESGSVSNIFDESGKNDKTTVDESPVIFWLSIGWSMSGILAAICLAIFFWRKNITAAPTTPNP